MKSAKQLPGDESGMAMALAVIMIALFSVMGAGLLVFATTDLGIVVESNQSQRAFEMADAGVQAAKRQLVVNSNFAAYNGDSDDLQWSAIKPNTDPKCSGLGGYGVCISNLDGVSATDDAANVTIKSLTGGRFLIVSTGGYGAAKRKVEATIRIGGGVSIPQVYLARGDLVITGSANPENVSFFTLTNADVGNALGGTMDRYFGRWAQTSGSAPYPNSFGSYPNSYNGTARGTSIPGVGAWGTVSGSNAFRGTRSFDSTTNPSVVPDYSASPLPDAQKIAFPFRVSTPAEDKQEIDLLRKRALALESSLGGNYYIDSIPGNGVDNAGLPNGSRTINSWPSGSGYDTVVFYKYATYASGNDVSYSPPDSQAPCGAPDSPPPPGAAKGSIVVENGDVTWSGNRGFYGGVIARPYNASGNLITSAADNVRITGSPCLRGYANSGGQMYLSGNVSSGEGPPLNDFDSFMNRPQIESWRELYN